MHACSSQDLLSTAQLQTVVSVCLAVISHYVAGWCESAQHNQHYAVLFKAAAASSRCPINTCSQMLRSCDVRIVHFHVLHDTAFFFGSFMLCFCTLLDCVSSLGIHLCSFMQSIHFVDNFMTCNHELTLVLIWHFCCFGRDADSEELEQLRRQYKHAEAARRELEKRVKDAGTMQHRLLMACTVGYIPCSNICLAHRSLSTVRCTLLICMPRAVCTLLLYVSCANVSFQGGW